MLSQLFFIVISTNKICVIAKKGGDISPLRDPKSSFIYPRIHPSFNASAAMNQLNGTKDSKKKNKRKNSRTGNAFLKRLHFKHTVRILYVEDNIFNQELATYILEKLGCISEIANSGEEGIELLKTKSYDLVLMDINMPGLNGFETTRIIREELLIDIPIIAFTTNIEEEDIRNCLKEGMNDHIGKPYTEHQLSWMINKWTRERGSI